ncbi:hypothetical protein JK358_07910 [Nocardia sp. 2]|uniref:Uncharacterized protein n=1 Tax=Nocardia acididurans TaxID=2802282 RepID=A0ABS1M273_9NOCA|nr:hypothetical protein [Nocardia acididurans]MBL1074320.1 hypothetical protein [Nocardia acididurans]
MDLIPWLRRRTAIVPFLATAPGGTATRLAVEAAVRAAGWQPAESPAAANLLIVAGTPHGAFADAATRIHDSMPLPRTRLDLPEPATAATALAEAAENLRSGRAMDDPLEHTPDTTHPPSGPHHHTDHSDGMSGPSSTALHAHVDPVTGEQGHAGDEHETHLGGDGMHDHGGHGDGMHGHAGHAMSMDLPGGLAMADRAEDRDGLRLDVLTVPLGPVLRWWPAGLVVSAQLHGDIVSAATVSVIEGAGGESFWLGPWLRAAAGEPVTVGEGGSWQVARRLDSVASLLGVAGWDVMAVAAARLRDDVLNEAIHRRRSDSPGSDVDIRLRRFVRRVSMSRVLRWSLRGVGRIDTLPPGVSAQPTGGSARRLEGDARLTPEGKTGPVALPPGGLAGDAHDRLVAMLTGIEDIDRTGESALEPGEFVAEQVWRTRWILDALPGLLAGSELAEARLLVASLDPDLETFAPARSEAVHG